jgi:hypothetical protein
MAVGQRSWRASATVNVMASAPRLGRVVGMVNALFTFGI